MFRRRITSCTTLAGITIVPARRRFFAQPTPPLLYVYQPPGSHEPSLPWYRGGGANSANTTNAGAAPTTARQIAATAETSSSTSALLSDAAIARAASSSSSSSSPSVVPRPSGSDSFSGPRAAASAAATTATAVNATPSVSLLDATRLADILSPPTSTNARDMGVARETSASSSSSPSLSAVKGTVTAAVHSVSSSYAQLAQGALRATPTRRMSALAGPSLDTRIEDIVKVSEDLSAEPLPKVVQLLIDPNAEGVEPITLAEFAAMQPRRQLAAVGGKKAWLDWVLESPYYQQVSRLAAESPVHDLRALQQAGIYTLQQWVEQPNVVKVSARTRSALDASVEHSITTYMKEVAVVVNTSNQYEELLHHWVSDVVGKFVLDSLKISVEAASAAMWKKRAHAMPGSRDSGNGSGKGASSSASEALRLMMLMDGTDAESVSTGGTNGTGTDDKKASDASSSSSSSSTTTAATSGAAGAAPQLPLLRPGEACTLEHYTLFVRKVLHSVRQDYAAQHSGTGLSSSSSSSMSAGIGIRGDHQSELEIVERTNTVIAAAVAQLLEQAQQQHLPQELRPLQENGYLALDRVPGLLKRAVSFLQLRHVPVRYFVFHSTAEASAALTPSDLTRRHHHHQQQSGSGSAGSGKGGHGGQSSAAEAAAALSVSLDVSAPLYAPGTFLTGTENADVTLGEWTGRPEPPSPTNALSGSSSSASAAGMAEEDPAQQEYFSVLHRLRRHLDRLALTSVYEILQRAEECGGNGFNASEALGLHQLFGPAKLVEDRLAAVLSFPVATQNKPMHFIEASYTSGKTALLERLVGRTRAGEKAVLVRYGGSAMPFVPDLDDHPAAFPARFWFRVALASCPFLIRTEELFTRAPRSVMWWGSDKNWSWESFQSLIASANRVGSSRRRSSNANSDATSALGNQDQLTAILVDDIDRVLDAMEAKWGDLRDPAELRAIRREVLAEAGEEEEETYERNGDNDNDGGYEEGAAAQGGAGRGRKASLSSSSSSANSQALLPVVPGALSAEQRQQALAQWTAATGKSMSELLAACFAKVTTALGQVDIVLTGQRLSPLLLAHSNSTPCRRYFIPVASGVGLQQRLRVLPLMAALNALHLRSHLEMPGVLYEVLKNNPALAGKTLEMFWTGRVATMDLRTGASSRMVQWVGGEHHLLQSYSPRELLAELPLCLHLLHNPRQARLRLVELLQRQLSSPTGYLSTGIDATVQDARDGLVSPLNHTSCQVHPFALFTIFSHQDALESRAGSGSSSSSVSASTAGGASSSSSGAANGGGASAGGSGLIHSSPTEKKVVRAWAEVWAEYRAVVYDMATTAERKRDAMRVLLHGALLLRSAAVAGAQLDLNLKVPPYGFPLLASEVRVKGKQPSVDGQEVRKATADTVRKAVAAYKSFFSTATQSHFPFRPLVGLNGGCDVVFVAGSTLALYDIVTTTSEMREMVGRFAESLLGVLHVLEKQVLPVDKVKHVHYVTVVSIDQAMKYASGGSSGVGVLGVGPGGGVSGVGGAGGAHSPSSTSSGIGSNAMMDVFSPASSSGVVPYFLDFGQIFDDAVMDRLRAIQEPLGVTKEFRTLNDLLDELERGYRVHVHHTVVASQEELESLFSPTLMQLVPDATVLPPYRSPVVSAEELMREAMLEGDDDDDDMDVPTGAEVEEVVSDALLSKDASTSPSVKQQVLVADHEHVQESAELLEAMLNDQLDEWTNTSSRQQAATASTAQDLRNDLAMEDRINYVGTGGSALGSTGPPSSSSAAAAAASSRGADGGAATSSGTAAAARPAGASPSASALGSPKAVSDLEADSLAWLHDIITPETLLAGLHGTANAARTATSADGKQSNSAMTNSGRGDDNEGGFDDDDGDGEGEDDTVDGVDDTASVFPLTAAKRSSHSGSVSSGRVGARQATNGRRTAAGGSVANLQQFMTGSGNRSTRRGGSGAGSRSGGGGSSSSGAGRASSGSARRGRSSAGSSSSSAGSRSSARTKGGRSSTASGRRGSGSASGASAARRKAAAKKGGRR